MKTLHLAIVAPEDLPIPPTRGGSVQIYIWGLVCAMAELRAEDPLQLSVLAPNVPTSDACPFPEGHRVHLEAFLPPSGASPKWTKEQKRMHYRRWVRKRLQALRPDVVQIENRPDIVNMVKSAVPESRVVLNLHSTTFTGPRHINRAKAIRALKQADGVVLNSRYLKHAIAEKFGLHSKDWHPNVLHPGASVDRFVQENSERKHSERKHSGRKSKQRAGAVGSDGTFRLLFVGRVIQQKGVHVIIKALRQLRQAGIPAELVVVGKTPPWERGYRERVRKLSHGLPVHWHGFVPPQDLPTFYWNADLFVCPSQRDEAFGLVNVEAMAAGLPVVASTVGGIPEVVGPRAGMLVSSYRRPDAFARAIKYLWHHPTQYHRKARRAQRRAYRFTWERTASKFEDLYRELAAGSR